MIGIYTKEFSSVWVGVACDDQRVFGVYFACCEGSVCLGLLESLPFGVSFQVFRNLSPFAEQVIAWVKDVYDGKDVSRGFCLAMDHLPTYTRRVLEVTSAIPVGYVASYGEIAKAAGGGARAVGNVMARNPFAPVSLVIGWLVQILIWEDTAGVWMRSLRSCVAKNVVSPILATSALQEENLKSFRLNSYWGNLGRASFFFVKSLSGHSSNKTTEKAC